MTAKVVNQLSGIRLSERERAALGKAMGIHNGAERRRHRRYLLPKEFTLVVRIQQPGGSTSIFSVTPRDLSTSGMGFFHATYVHPGTECELMMRTLKGDSVVLTATVMRCRHVSGRIHEVGCLFKEEVNVELYVADMKRAAEAESEQRVDDIHRRLSELAQELKLLADRHAATSELLAKVGELAVLITPRDVEGEVPSAPA